jgi:hypothetical protein
VAVYSGEQALIQAFIDGIDAIRVSVAGTGDAKQLAVLLTRLTAGADRAVPVGRRSVTVTVVTKAGAGSPTWDGVELPAGYSASVSVDFPGDTLPAITIATAAGDDVIVLETS